MKLHGSLLASLALGAVISIGCNKPAETNGPGTTGSTVASATGAPSAPLAGKTGKHHGKHFGGRGPSAMLFRAAHQQTLTEAQQTKLEEASKSLKGDDASPRDEMKNLHQVMVDGVKAGKIDTAKFDAARAEVEKAMAARRDKEAEALNTLHATLDPAQRKAVVAAARDKIARRDQKMGKWKDKMGPGDGPEGPGAGAGAGKGPGKGFAGAMMVERMTADLGLDDAQKKKVEALVAKQPAKTPPDREAMKKQMDELLTAFEGDTFDAKKLDAFSKPAEMKPMGHMDPAFVTQLLAILKPEQREKLAAKLEKGPPPGFGGKMGGKMGGPMHPPGHMGPGPMDDDDADDDGEAPPAPKTP